MIDVVIQALIGLTAGFLGGLLGVGGSIIIIPGFIFYLSHTPAGYSGSDQHLIQAAAMVCNIFVAAPAVYAHHKAQAIMPRVIVKLIPAALIGIFVGVALSNSQLFERENGHYLAYILTGFLLYVAAYNVQRLFSKSSHTKDFDEKSVLPTWKIIMVGFPMGIFAGLLGVGGGALCVPAQQLILKLPLRRAIANSAATILFIAFFGALYKNLTLSQHGITITSSMGLALLLIPTAILGSFIGGKLTHKLPRHILRIIFIIFILVVAWITFSRVRTVSIDSKVTDKSGISHLTKNESNIIFPPASSCRW